MDLALYLAGLSTPHLADAALRLRLPFAWPQGIRPQTRAARDGLVWGPARPVRHFGSVDIFLEAIDSSRSGDILVVDNGGLLTEGCIGDLVAREALAAG